MSPRGPSAEQVERFRASLERLTGGTPGRFGVAVSGGPDSLALLLLAAAAHPGDIEAATVDHGLRAESAAEAEFVAEICAGLGIPHRVLRPEAQISGNLQSAAREARYDLLEAWRAVQGLDWILTAHHADDQAETLLMRLNRGSGIGGMSAIRAANGRVLRPLLDWRRSELADIVEAAGIAPVADPSNMDERFDRARLRAQITKVDWVDVGALARSAGALAEAQDALDWTADQLFEERARPESGGLSIDPSCLPAELVRRLVLRALRCIAADADPRGEELSRLIAALEQGATATLAGAKAVGGAVWRFTPAPPRRGSG